MDEKRCIVTGNICGTDTVMVGMECPSTSGRCAHKTYIGLSPEYAAGYKAGRAAGMREASEIAYKAVGLSDGDYCAIYARDAILSVIEGAK